VLGSWFNNHSAKKTDVYTMDVVEFIEGATLRKDRWKVRLKNQEDNSDEFFLMNFSAMCKYLLPVTTPDPVQHLQPTLAQSKSFQPVLPSDLPLIDDFLVTQAKDPTLVIWFTWLKEQKPPPPEHPQYHWWISDKDAMFLNEVDLLCRFALISTSAAARKCSQVVVPTDFIPKVLHFVHGSDSFGHQGFLQIIISSPSAVLLAEHARSIITTYSKLPMSGHQSSSCNACHAIRFSSRY
jgi:hypothetical protein